MMNGLTNHLPFWLKPISNLWLVPINGISNSSLTLALPFSLAPFRMVLADSLYPHGFDLPLARMGYIVPSASYNPVTRVACDGRLLPRERQVLFCLYLHQEQLLRRPHVAPSLTDRCPGRMLRVRLPAIRFSTSIHQSGAARS